MPQRCGLEENHPVDLESYVFSFVLDANSFACFVELIRSLTGPLWSCLSCFQYLIIILIRTAGYHSHHGKSLFFFPIPQNTPLSEWQMFDHIVDEFSASKAAANHEAVLKGLRPKTWYVVAVNGYTMKGKIWRIAEEILLGYLPLHLETSPIRDKRSL